MTDCGNIGQPPCPPKSFSEVIAERGEPAPPIPADSKLRRIAAARAVVNFQKKNRNMSPDEMAEISAHYGQDAEEVAAYLQNLRADHGQLVASALQGFTMRFGDELVGALPDALGGGEAAKEELRLRTELASLDNPTLAAIAEIGGGVASAAVTGGLGATRLGLSTAKTAALEGGGYGALYGAGGGETLKERAKGAAIEGTVGTLLGGAIGRVAEGVASYGSKGLALERELAAIEASGGFRALKQTLADFRAAGRGDDVITADLSPHLQRLGKYAAQNNQDTNVLAESVLRPRQANMTERLVDDMESLLGQPDAVKRAREIASKKRDWANEAYDDLKETDVSFDLSEIEPYLGKRTVDRAVAQARLAGDLKAGDPLADLLARLRAGSRDPKDIAAAKRIADSGDLDAERPFTFEDLQQLKRELDDRIGTAYNKGRGGLAESYQTIRDAVRETILAKVPQYAAVDRKYAAMSKLQEMLQEGVDTWGQRGVRELEEMMAALSPRQQNEFRLGMASRLMDTLRDAGKNRNVAKQLEDGSISMQEKLRVIFGDEQTFDTFMGRVGKERTMATSGRAIVGSDTHLLGIESGHTPMGSAHHAAYGWHGLVAGAARVLFGNKAAQMKGRTAGIVGEDMFTKGSAQVDALLARLQQPVSILGRQKAARYGRGAGITAPYTSSLFDTDREIR